MAKQHTLSYADHAKRHQELHKSLDELLADYLDQTGADISDIDMFKFLEWSHAQCTKPTVKAPGFVADVVDRISTLGTPEHTYVNAPCPADLSHLHRKERVAVTKDIMTPGWHVFLDGRSLGGGSEEWCKSVGDLLRAGIKATDPSEKDPERC